MSARKLGSIAAIGLVALVVAGGLGIIWLMKVSGDNDRVVKATERAVYAAQTELETELVTLATQVAAERGEWEAEATQVAVGLQQKQKLATPTAMPTALPMPTAGAVVGTTEPQALEAHERLYAEWYNQGKPPKIMAAAIDRWVVISTDPCVFHLEDMNGQVVWEYNTSASKGALAFIKLPAGWALTVTQFGWQENANHWPISGSSYATEVEGKEAWDLLLRGPHAETKPLYITNIEGDLRTATVTTVKP